MSQGRKLVWAALLAVGLWQFALFGFFGPRGESITLWGDYLSPWLQRLGMTAPILAAGVVTSCLLRPRRPEQLAALVAAAAALPIALPDALPNRWWSALLVFLFGGGSRGLQSLGFEPHYWSRELMSSVHRLFLMFWVVGLPAVVAGWVGARYWRAGNWEHFWRGPGGAIIRGGLVTGAVGIVLELARWYFVLRPITLATPGLHSLAWPGPMIRHLVILNLGTVASGAMMTALLVGWRPRWWWGAFAGSGLALGLFSLSLLLGAVRPGSGGALTGRLLVAAISVAVAGMVKGAVAGGYAGSWEDSAET